MRPAAKVIVWTALTLALVTALTQWFLTLLHRPKAFPGYTLVAPLLSTKTNLVDMEGRVVRTWPSDYTAGQTAYLLENGHLLRAGQLRPEERLFASSAAGGRVQEFTWEGELVWDFKFHNANQVPHHDFTRLPNGNILLIVWERKTAEAIVAAGRRPEGVDGPWLADSVIEIQPTGTMTGEVVWEWHVWDHLIQDRDPSQANYGDVAAHPERIDINVGETLASEVARVTPSPDTLKTLRSIGYVDSSIKRGNSGITTPDWTHVNAVAYNAEFDQILLTVRQFNEFWIIDHSTTTAEAAGHTGGRGGQGGDLLYRWGNPRTYRAGTQADQRLFVPHDAHWIPRDHPGAGHVLVFNNGLGRPGGDYSSVDEIVLPIDTRGRYAREPARAYEPHDPVWRYTAPRKRDFLAGFMSGAQRLPNGNTLICHGVSGTIFEVTPHQEVVWEYICPAPTEPRPSGLGIAPGRDRVFRAHRYGMDYAGLAGKNLRPGG
jgi:hypothetical protein